MGHGTGQWCSAVSALQQAVASLLGAQEPRASAPRVGFRLPGSKHGATIPRGDSLGSWRQPTPQGRRCGGVSRSHSGLVEWFFFVPKRASVFVWWSSNNADCCGALRCFLTGRLCPRVQLRRFYGHLNCEA